MLRVMILFILLIAGCGGGDGNDTDGDQAEAQVETAVRQARVKQLLKVKVAEQRRREEHPGQVLAPSHFSGELASRYESDREVCNNNVDVFIRFLRAKVDVPGIPALIHTVRGIGYCLRDPAR